LDTSAKRQHFSLNELVGHLTTLPTIENSIKDLEKELKQLLNLFLELENKLGDLENQKEIEKYDKLQLDHQYQLAVYKEQRASEFETLKVKLALDHAQKVRDYEKRQQTLLRERQQAFQTAFEEELNLYKAEGKIQKQGGVVAAMQESVTAIEDVVVEADEAEAAALAEFLKD